MQNDTLTLTLTAPAPEAAVETVETRWEACGGFSADDAGSPVCAECGWLAPEHRTAANVRKLPVPAAPRGRSRRLAS